jgi:hypothetical protein
MGNEPPEGSSPSQWPRIGRWVAVIVGAVCIAEVFTWLVTGTYEGWLRGGAAVWLYVAGAAVGLGAMGWIAGAGHRQADRAVDAGRERVREAERGVEGALSDNRDLALARLWSLTHRRLDLYHEIATNQAQRSFVSAQLSMAVGFALLVLFVVLALNVSSTTGAIVTGGLGAVSAALAGFISKTFVKSQQSAADHLKAYFDQPLEFSRYLAAERMLADAGLSDEKRAEVVAMLVQTIAAGPGSNAADTNGLVQQMQGPLPDQP